MEQTHASAPWILSVDNIFLDIAIQLPNNQFITDHGFVPGSQYTATTAALKEFAQKLINMKEGEHGSKEMSRTVGGCAMNTSRSANLYLQALYGEKSEGRVKTMGSIGDDENGKWIQSKLQEEKLAVDLLQVPNVLTGSCPVTVVDADRTCVAILDAG